jgi:serine/threonine protein kinase
MAMGRVHHPGIAQVLSAESLAWPDGSIRSALVIEYVRGSRLSDFASSHGLSVNDSIEIVLQICDAVAAAHRAGVVHHDVKPANLLVEVDAGVLRVKLVDFGISAIVGDSALHGAISQVYGSVRYAAPERLNGKGAWAVLDARSDIYSIGVVLRELIEAVHDPSHRLQGPYGSDLTLIIAKATASKPMDRYGTIDAMAGDLRNLIALRPIAARKPSVGYTSTRFIQRNPLIATLIALAAFGCGGTLWLQAQETARTEQARGEAKEAASLLLNGVAEGLRDEIGASEKHREILMRLLPTLEQFAARYPREPRTQTDLANLLSSLGDVLQQRGDLVHARETLSRAYAVRLLLADLLRDDPMVQADLSIAMVRLGDVGVPPIADHAPRGWYRAALERDDILVKRWPDDARLLSNLAFSYDRLASAELGRGWISEAIALSDRQMAVARQLEAREHQSERSLRTLSAAVSMRAYLTATRRDYNEAARLLRENMSLLKALDAAAPNQRGVHKLMVDTGLSLSVYTVEEASGGGYPREAVDLLVEATAKAAQLAAVDPSDPYVWDLYLRVLTARHTQLLALGESIAAESVWQEVRRSLDGFAEGCGNCEGSVRRRVQIMVVEANQLRTQGQVERSLVMIRELLPVMHAMYDAKQERDDAGLLADLYMNLSVATVAERNMAVDYAQAAIGGDDADSTIVARVRVVEALLQAMRHGEALSKVRALQASIPSDEVRLHAWLRELENRCTPPSQP